MIKTRPTLYSYPWRFAQSFGGVWWFDGIVRERFSINCTRGFRHWTNRMWTCTSCWEGASPQGHKGYEQSLLCIRTKHSFIQLPRHHKHACQTVINILFSCTFKIGLPERRALAASRDKHCYFQCPINRVNTLRANLSEHPYDLLITKGRASELGTRANAIVTYSRLEDTWEGGNKNITFSLSLFIFPQGCKSNVWNLPLTAMQVFSASQIKFLTSLMTKCRN